MKKSVFLFAGYSFETREEFIAVRKEAEAIKHINEKLDANDIQALLEIYKKLVARELFKTVVGINYLHEIRQHLIEKGGISPEDLPYVPVSSTMQASLSSVSVEGVDSTKAGEINEKSIEAKAKAEKKQIKKANALKQSKNGFRGAIAAIIVLLAVIAFGVFVLFNGDNLNIVNYKDRLQEKYETWEADLTERERVLNEKSLNIK